MKRSKRSYDKHYEKKKQRRKALRDLIIEIKDNQKCVDCGNKFRWWVLDFDHLRDKLFNVADAASNSMSTKKVLEEICKCELVCANCHRNRTHKRRLLKLSSPNK